MFLTIVTMCIVFASELRSQVPVVQLAGAKVAEIKKNVVFIEASNGPGLPSCATGFVVLAPFDEKDKTKKIKVILTCGHLIKGGPEVSAKFPGQEEGIRCDLVDYNFEADLLALVPKPGIDFPKDVEGLTVDFDYKIDPDDGPAVCSFGYPAGLQFKRNYGVIGGGIIAAKKLVNPNAGDINTNIYSPGGETELIWHSCSSIEGGSGGPLVNINGHVIGMQIAKLTNSSNSQNKKFNDLILAYDSEGFAIAAKHFKQLKFTTNPDPELFSKAIKQIAAQKQSTERVLKTTSTFSHQLNHDESSIAVSVYETDVIPLKASEIILHFITGPEFENNEELAQALTKYMDNNPVKLVTCPEFRFSFLLPATSRYKANALPSKEGIALEIENHALTDKNSLNKACVTALTLPPVSQLSKADWLHRLKKSFPNHNAQLIERDGIGAFRNDPQASAEYLRLRTIFGGLDYVSTLEFKELKLRETDKEDYFKQLDSQGQDTGQIVTREGFTDTQSLRRDQHGNLMAWIRFRYLNTSTAATEEIHCGTRIGTLVIVKYPMEPIINPGKREVQANPAIEQLLIRASLSFY